MTVSTWLIVLLAFSPLISLGILYAAARWTQTALRNTPKSLRTDFESLAEGVRETTLKQRMEINELIEDIAEEREKTAVERKRLSMERARQAKREQRQAVEAESAAPVDRIHALRAEARKQGHRLM